MSRGSSLNVSLTPEWQHFVTEKVQSGRYHSASEVIREGLRLLEERDQIREIRIQELKNKIAAGVDQLDAGLGEEFDAAEIKATLRERYAEKE